MPRVARNPAPPQAPRRPATSYAGKPNPYPDVSAGLTNLTAKDLFESSSLGAKPGIALIDPRCGTK